LTNDDIVNQNVEVVRQVLDRWHGGELSLSSFADDVVWDYTSFPDGRVVQGHEEVKKFMRRWLGTWDRYEIHVEQILDAGDDVVALTHERGRGRGSDAQVELRGALVFSVAGGKIVRFKGFLDRGEALTFVGLTAGTRRPSSR
jgi:ketosteroid isomerase-like protein